MTEAALSRAPEEFGSVQVLADLAKDNAFVVVFKSTAAVDAAPSASGSPSAAAPR